MLIILESIIDIPNFNFSTAEMVGILSIILSISLTYLVVNKIFVELPKISIKRLITTNYLFVSSGAFLALLFEAFIVFPVLNTVTSNTTSISPVNDFLGTLLSIFMVSLLLGIFSFLVFYVTLYLIQIKLTKKLPFRSLISSELLKLSFVLGLIMGIFSLLNYQFLSNLGSSIIIESISLGSTALEIIFLIAITIFYFTKYNPEIWQFRSKTFLIFNVLLIYLGMIAIRVINFILPFNQPSISLVLSLENDFSTTIIVWLILVFAIFIKELYQTHPRNFLLSKGHQMISK